MTTVTISYLFTPPEYDGRADDIEALQDSIIHALDYHFPDWEDAAAALDDYRLAEAEAQESGGLFSAGESWRLALAAHPRAAEWAQFLDTARDAGGMVYSLTGLAACGAPFAFAIKFNTLTDTKPVAAPAAAPAFDSGGPG